MAWEVLEAWPTWTEAWTGGCPEVGWVETGWAVAWTGAWAVATWLAREDHMLEVEVPAEVSPQEPLLQGRDTTVLIETGTVMEPLTATLCPSIGRGIGVWTDLRPQQGWAAIPMDLRQGTRTARLVTEDVIGA